MILIICVFEKIIFLMEYFFLLLHLFILKKWHLLNISARSLLPLIQKWWRINIIIVGMFGLIEFIQRWLIKRINKFMIFCCWLFYWFIFAIRWKWFISFYLTTIILSKVWLIMIFVTIIDTVSCWFYGQFKHFDWMKLGLDNYRVAMIIIQSLSLRLFLIHLYIVVIFYLYFFVLTLWNWWLLLLLLSLFSSFTTPSQQSLDLFSWVFKFLYNQLF